MCHSSSVESLFSFGISDINKLLRMRGYSLQKIDSSFLPGPGNYARLPLSWRDNRGKTHAIEVYLLKDSGGLYLELRYNVSRGGTGNRSRELRYYLTRRESNLKTGTYLYYIKNPYTLEEKLCTRLYLLPDLGDFVPRSVLSSFKVLYSQQRKGKRERIYSPKTLPDKKHRKTHYRGKATPFWNRLQKLQEENDLKFIAFGVGLGVAKGIPLPDRGKIEEIIRKSGRKYVPGLKWA